MKRFSSIVILLLAGCGTDPDANAGQSTAEVFLGSVPVGSGSIGAVVVSVEAVQVHSTTTGWVDVGGEPHTVDLTKLSEDAFAALGISALAPGHYTQLRILVSDMVANINGEFVPVSVPNGEDTGLKLVPQWRIEPGVEYTMQVNLDLAHSLIAHGDGTYSFIPVMKATILAD